MTLEITKKLFVETIHALEKQYKYDSKCAKHIQAVFNDNFISGYDNHLLTGQLVKMLQLAFNDAHKESWIEYYLYELDFGKKYRKGCATNKDGSEIKLSNAGELYDFLIINMKTEF